MARKRPRRRSARGGTPTTTVSFSFGIPICYVRRRRDLRRAPRHVVRVPTAQGPYEYHFGPVLVGRDVQVIGLPEWRPS